MIVNMVVETERLFLREMTEEDFNALYRILADSDIMQHYPYSFDEKRIRGWIIKNIERYKIFGFGLWAVCLKETGEMIGDCGLTMQLINHNIKPEIGYHIRKDFQRNGYAKEAAIAVRDWTFANTSFNMIFSYMKCTNIPSCKTAISYGCRQVDEYLDEENEMTRVFAITREEWAKYSRGDDSNISNEKYNYITLREAPGIKEQAAEWFHSKWGIPKEAKKKIKPGAEIIYLGWIMAGKIKGYAQAAKRYKIQAVCGVGMGQTGTQLVEVGNQNKIPQNIPIFTLQGNFDIQKLHGIYKLIMNVMVKTAGKALADKPNRTPEEDDMLDMMQSGSERVKAENLKGIIDWYDAK